MTASARHRWWPPLACVALFALAAPFVGVAQASLRESYGLAYLPWVALALALAGLAALATAVLRIRDHRPLRYGLLGLAAGMIGWQVAAWGIGEAEVDIVERVHLLEFGIVGALFERAFRARHRNVLLPVLSLAAVGLAGLVDESVQWLTMVRVGDGRDVLLNLWAGGVGYLLAVALSAGRGRLRPPAPASRRLALTLSALFVLGAAVFFDVAHLGHEVRDPKAGVFRSWYGAAELAREAEERDRRWAAEGVPSARPLTLEDPYLTEAGFHVGERNRAVERGAFVHAWRENRILERWYDPLLEHRPRSRWPPEQRAHLEAEVRALENGRRILGGEPGYRSPALVDRIAVAPPRPLFWLGVAAIVGALLGALAADPAARRKMTAPRPGGSAGERGASAPRLHDREVTR